MCIWNKWVQTWISFRWQIRPSHVLLFNFRLNRCCFQGHNLFLIMTMHNWCLLCQYLVIFTVCNLCYIWDMGLIKNIIQVLKSENIFIQILDLQLTASSQPGVRVTGSLRIILYCEVYKIWWGLNNQDFPCEKDLDFWLDTIFQRFLGWNIMTFFLPACI